MRTYPSFPLLRALSRNPGLTPHGAFRRGHLGPANQRERRPDRCRLPIVRRRFSTPTNRSTLERSPVEWAPGTPSPDSSGHLRPTPSTA
jgi:hypothetical protein